MASLQKHKYGDGSKAVIAWVRIKPFKPANKSFPTQKEAEAWADALEAELRKQRSHGGARKDLTALTIAGLIKEYLADPETKALRTYDDVERLLAWRVNHCAADKILEFGAVKLREARELLSNGRENGTVNRYLGALCSCWSWGRAAQFIPTEKVWPTRLLLNEPRERVRFLNDGELKAVLEAAETHAPWMRRRAREPRHGPPARRDAAPRVEGHRFRQENRRRGREGHYRPRHQAPNRALAGAAITALKKLRRDGIVGPKLVFLDANGEPADKSFLTFHWNKVRTAAGLIDFRWHDLRHSCASFLAQNGATLVEIGSVFGHSSPSITAKHSHLVAGRPVTGADKLAEKLGTNL